jgi:DNA polymerase-3 subunit delta'
MRSWGQTLADSWGTALCPWLFEGYGQLVGAHAQGHLGHAWLFAGPKGIGKANLAVALAGYLLNSGGGDPARLDPERAAALMRTRHDEHDHHPDLHYLTPAPDKRAISVEQVRDLIAALELTSHEGVAKALVVDPAESMTLAAANALLKTLEEPTPSTYFLLVSHQSGLLPATVRSRCQVVSVSSPPTGEALDWLCEGAGDASRGDLAALLRVCGGSPLRALDLSDGEYANINKELELIFKQLSENKIDPQLVAEQWLKAEPEICLNWLSTRLEWAIKGRLAPEAWTPVTDLGGDALHNTWDDLTLRTLFERLQETRDLLGRLGRGVNAELALRVLLLGFQPGRGRT